VDPAGVVEKLKAAKIPYYTEPIATKDGTVTRVRAGPFASREAADKVQKQLKDLGLKPGNVASKS
jgi:DedD protein